jgi:hypothetical protein
MAAERGRDAKAYGPVVVVVVVDHVQAALEATGLNN